MDQKAKTNLICVSNITDACWKCSSFSACKASAHNIVALLKSEGFPLCWQLSGSNVNLFVFHQASQQPDLILFNLDIKSEIVDFNDDSTSYKSLFIEAITNQFQL